jgi:gamma-glutamylcyclotransferase (GGCT)/AIG2-like uncharacterized protein YtfP
LGIGLHGAELEAALREINAIRSRSEAERDFDGGIADVLGQPAHGLIVYGTLAPGRENHHLLADLDGEWSEITIAGVLGDWMGYPMFRWSVGGPSVDGWLLRSPMLPAHYPRLDDFETAAYARHLVPYVGSEGAGVANCYVAASHPDGVPHRPQ